jgi:hypothetical protein
VKPCLLCAGTVGWCHDDCHFIRCLDCGTVFDLSDAVEKDAETLDDLRALILERWTNRDAPECTADTSTGVEP